MQIKAAFSRHLEAAAAASALALCTAVLVGVVAFAQRSSRDETREDWQKVPEIFAALEVREGSSVADIGAGRGFFTTRLARAVGPHGRIYAVDIAEDELRRLRERVREEGLTQVEVVEGKPDDPGLPRESVDAALIINAYHEMRHHQAMLAAIRRALKPAGRLVIVEPIMEDRRGETRERQQSRHEVEARYVEEDLRDAGYEVLEVRDPFTRRPEGDIEWMIIAVPRDRTPPAQLPAR